MALDGTAAGAISIPKLGAMHAVAESARNVACTGATPIAATNCLNFGNPEKPHIMWQFLADHRRLDQSLRRVGDAHHRRQCQLYNETLGEGIYPTPVIGVVGIMEDVHKAVGPHFRGAGRVLVVLCGCEPGDTSDVEAEFGRRSMPRRSLARFGLPAVAGIGEGSGPAEGDCGDDRPGADRIRERQLGGRTGGDPGGMRLRARALVPRWTLVLWACARIRPVWRRRQPDPDFLRPAKRGRIQQLAVQFGLSAERSGKRSRTSWRSG